MVEINRLREMDAQAESAEQRAVSSSAAPESGVSSHFWVSTFPYFETTLVITPPLYSLPLFSSTSSSSITSRLFFYDADGKLINDSSLETSSGAVSMLELDQFLGGCKLESGLKHAHLIVRSPAGTGHHCRIQGREYAAMLGEPFRISAAKAGFFPVTFSTDRSNLLTLINYSMEEANLRCRLFLGKRCPEVVWSIPALGSRVINIEVEFREYAEAKEGQQLQAYLRVTTKSNGLGAQLVERSESSSEQGAFVSGIFSSVS